MNFNKINFHLFILKKIRSEIMNELYYAFDNEWMKTKNMWKYKYNIVHDFSFNFALAASMREVATSIRSEYSR